MNGKYVTIKILKSSRKDKIEYRDGKSNYSVDISERCRFSEAQDEIELNDGFLRKAENSAEELIRSECTGYTQRLQG